MKTRIVHTRFWQDSFVATLNHKEKLVFIYLLTNDRVSLTGIYELPDKYILIDLDLSKEELEVIKQKLSGKIDFVSGWIVIVKHDLYNSYSHGKAGIARNKELTEIPLKIRQYVSKKYTTTNTSIHTSMDTYHKPETINHKLENRVIGEGELVNGLSSDDKKLYNAGLLKIINGKVVPTAFDL